MTTVDTLPDAVSWRPEDDEEDSGEIHISCSTVIARPAASGAMSTSVDVVEVN